ncbi:hypothetical protein CaCOL14_008027 [Colletotrichum acutatum]
MCVMASNRHAWMPVSQSRSLLITLNSITILPFLWINLIVFVRSKHTLLDIVVVLCGTICIPWPIVCFWNSAIGLCIILFGNAERSVYPYFRPRGPLSKLRSTTALTIFMRNEDPGPVFDRLYAMYESLQQTNCLKHFRFVLLSDTGHVDVVRSEEEVFAQHAVSLSEGMAKSLLYRRRDRNTGYKAGNLKDYLDNHSKEDDFFVTLDSDSAMSGDLLVRLVSSMEENPLIGLLQTIVIGMPAFSAFTRLFQFGLRHGVRTYNMGFSWWAHDCALYWGHNAIIRTDAFHKHCMLPKAPWRAAAGWLHLQSRSAGGNVHAPRRLRGSGAAYRDGKLRDQSAYLSRLLTSRITLVSGDYAVLVHAERAWHSSNQPLSDVPDFDHVHWPGLLRFDDTSMYREGSHRRA